MGDTLFFADTQLGATKQTYVSQSERATISSINGNAVTLTAPLQFSHVQGGYIGNLTRNITFSSGSGTPGHTMFMGNTMVNVSDAAFVNMGRTEAANLDDTQFDATGNLISVGTNQKRALRCTSISSPLPPS